MTATAAPERKWTMTRLRVGDYLLPSNDGLTLWRLTSYEEDGNAYYVDARGRERAVTGTFWEVRKWPHDVHYDEDGMVDAGQAERIAASIADADWDAWTWWAGPFSTRAEAIKEVL